MNPEDIAELDADAQRLLGKSIYDCTAGDLELMMKRSAAELAAKRAAFDQFQAACTEVLVCGCHTFSVPVDEDGTRDFGRVRIVHTCGK